MSFLIGELSNKINLSIDTIRYYEKMNLIKPKRNENGRRIYDDNDVKWIEFIIKLKRAKMSISEIREYSELRLIGRTTINQRYDILLTHRDKLEEDIKETMKTINTLDEKIKTYREML